MALFLKSAAGLILLFLLPGYACVRFLCMRARFLQGYSFWSRLFVIILISILIVSWSSLILAECGWFSLGLVVGILLILFIAMLLLARGDLSTVPISRSMKETVAVLLMICIGLAFFAPPHEYIFGNWDPGTYVNTGAHLAREGSITINDQTLRVIPPEDRHLFYYTHLVTQRYEGGMAIADSDEAIVSPHFYHLYTCWIALFHSLGGVRFSLWVNIVFALLAVAAIYATARELAGGRTALLAALLVMFGAAQIWNARFPTAEIVTQFLLWSGFFCLLRYLDEESPVWSWVSGICFAEMMLTRFTAIVVLPFLLIIIVWRNRHAWRRNDLWLVIPLAAGVAHLVAQNATVCRHYFDRQMEVLRSQGISPLLLLVSAVAFLCLLGLILVAGRRWRGRLPLCKRGLATLRSMLPYFLPALFLAGYYLRPLLDASPDARNLRELGWFIYPLAIRGFYFPAGLFLAMGGVILFLKRGMGEKRAAFAALVLPVCIIFLFKKMVFPSYPWAVRRFVPLVYPTLVFFMACALTKIGSRSRIARYAALFIVIILLGCMQIRYVPPVRATDFRGAVDFIESLACRMDESGIYICEGSSMAEPLDCMYGFRMLQLSEQTPEKCRGVERVMLKLINRGEHVYYISRGGWPLSPVVDFIPRFSVPYESDYLEHRVGRFPRWRRKVSYTARVFRVEAIRDGREEGTVSRTIDVGEDCFSLLGGFHAPQRHGGTDSDGWGRWTNGEARMVIPSFGGKNALGLTLMASAGRSRPGGPVTVSIAVGEEDVAVLKIGTEFAEHRCNIPASALPGGEKRAVLSLTSPVWNPADEGIGGYPEELGIYLDFAIIFSAPD